MSLNIGIQMDGWHTVNVTADSTFALMVEAQRRGHSLFHYLPTALSYDRGPFWRGAHRPVQQNQAHMAELGPEHSARLRILMLCCCAKTRRLICNTSPPPIYWNR